MSIKRCIAIKAFVIMALVNVAFSAITKPIELESDLTVKKEVLGEDLEQFYKDQAHLYQIQTNGQSVGTSSVGNSNLDRLPGMEQMSMLYDLVSLFTQLDLPFLINPVDTVETIAGLSMSVLSQLMDTYSSRESPKNQTLNTQTNY